MSIIYKSTIDILDAIGVIGIQFGRRSQLFRKLKSPNPGWSSPRVCDILGACRFYILELVNGGRNIPRHRDIDICFGVIPVQG